MPNSFANATPAELLCELISIPSVNPMGSGASGPEFFETRLTDFLESFFSSLSVPYERIEVSPGRCNLIARYDNPGTQATLLFDAHQDTVPVQGMTVPPFEPIIQDGKISGRGAVDVKGGMAAMLHAFARLVKERPSTAASVIMSCTCDEEAGTTGIQDLVSYWQKPSSRCRLITSPPDAAIVAEASELDVIVAHRGAVRWRANTHGTACHSSEPGRGVNAIYMMATVVDALRQYASLLPDSIPAHPLCGPPTLSVGRIGGGASVNVVPDHCWIEIDRRVIPGERREDVIPQVADFLTKQGIDVSFDEPWLMSRPLSDHDNHWIADHLLKLIDSVESGHRRKGVPFGTHASPINHAGVPAIVFGPGSIEQAHTKDEYIEARSLDQAAEIYFQLMKAPPPKPNGSRSTARSRDTAGGQHEGRE